MYCEQCAELMKEVESLKARLSEVQSNYLLDAGHFLAKTSHEFITAAELRHDLPNIAHCRGYVISKGDLRTAIARWREASNKV